MFRRSSASFSRSLTTKYVSLNNERCMIRLSLNDLNPAEFNFYPFMVILGKFSGSCNAVYDLSIKAFVQSKTKDKIF